jgi:hypothetical protein
MPFTSEAQRKWMWVNKPKMAKKWEKHTPKDAVLPEHVKKAEDTNTSALSEFFSKLAPYFMILTRENHGPCARG